MIFVNQLGLIFNLSNQYNAPNVIQLFRNNSLNPSQNLRLRCPGNDGIVARGWNSCFCKMKNNKTMVSWKLYVASNQIYLFVYLRIPCNYEYFKH